MAVTPVCQNCQFNQNLPNASFCSRCGASLSAPCYQAPVAQAVPVVAQGVPVQGHQEYVVVQPATVVNQVMVVPGQMLTVDGYCAHAVQTNDFTLCGIVLGILFFPAGILCCLLLTERKCVHCGAVLN
ncbi:hypothetical protein THRCLA_22000 [Thraustotheca clavata]|uniref:Membrane protein BRI3 n=1 Tax=Thraustotheca clavata TaxID=74557 RepID=A0A1V9ZEK4_9STRA|nr:hypothetical protein THRCLA_22000 [Thraustotheca clavata]